MKKLFGLYKSLPREVKMLVAMAGLGTPVGIFYFVQRVLFPGKPIWLIILIVAGIVAVLALLVFLISLIFGRSGKKRTKKMEADLASGAESGPASMDLRAAIKSNNEKFFGAIKGMRKLGISIYDLPWYIVIGDSGCGKTKLINEGGLTFSTGRPEGYQLGTLNYNWWFTEDAIFIDMAGRLCNPQEDADRREWEAFLKTVAAGRKGFPINGVLASVSAEHLLQDPPEKHEEDANTMLERLRDLQNKLGVTFATYLVVTKCDKIVGFMPFFDRAERDITIKNQIFGWSRPGGLEEVYDPERFGLNFDSIYVRLNELRLRRLNDDVDEFELGMAYSFPEEFRQLREPLQTYVRTLFPAIKHPRAVKNLIFRGAYFTSATQQGGLILRHLAERLGEDAARRFPSLESLYPRPRPHFVKDLLLRKVFPEEGLVFRNEKDVVRNRKLARLLLYGSTAAGLLLAVLLIVSAMKFNTLMNEPRAHAQEAPAVVSNPGECVAMTASLGEDIDSLGSSIWPNILSLNIGADKPITYLTEIQMHVFEDGILPRVLNGCDRVLRDGVIVAGTEGEAAGVPFETYLAGLEAYITWFGCAGEDRAPESVSLESFEALGELARHGERVSLPPKDELQSQARRYFAGVRERDDWGNPAGLLVVGQEDRPRETIRAGIQLLHGYLRRFATLDADHPNDVVGEWMRIHHCCVRMQDAYASLLEAANRQIGTQEDLDEFRTRFKSDYEAFAEAANECEWRLKTGPPLKIPYLADVLTSVRKDGWLAVRERLEQSYLSCRPDGPGDDVTRAIAALSAGGEEGWIPGLDALLYKSISDAKLTEHGYVSDYFEGSLREHIIEVESSFPHILELARGEGSADNDVLALTADTGTVRSVVAKIHGYLVSSEALAAEGVALPKRIASLHGLLWPNDQDERGTERQQGFSELHESWLPDDLEELNGTYRELVRKAQVTLQLRAIEADLSGLGDWGFAELSEDWREPRESAYTIRIPRADIVTPPTARERTEERPRLERSTGDQPPLTRERSRRPEPAPSRAESPPPVREGALVGEGKIPACATAELLNDLGWHAAQLLYFLEYCGPEHYFRGSEPEPLNHRCLSLVEQSWKTYCVQYVQQWDKAYGQTTLVSLTELGPKDRSWNEFIGQFRTGSGPTDDNARWTPIRELQRRLSEILRVTRWALYVPGLYWLKDSTTYVEELSRVSRMSDEAFREHWKHGGFVFEATAGGATAAEEKPWVTVAAGFTRDWKAWCDGVCEAKIPTTLPEPGYGTKYAIPWAGVADRRDATNLHDERLTQQLVDYQEKAKQLLSAELTRVLVETQGVFGETVPYEGWPYKSAEGRDLTALETVEFNDFQTFLLLVRKAEKLLETLETGLPDDEAQRQRRAFLERCKEWREFLGLDERGSVDPLTVEVWIKDPVVGSQGGENADDAAQFYYHRVCLSIGLRRTEGESEADSRGLCFRTMDFGEANDVSTVWEWAQPRGLSELTFSLKEPREFEREGEPYPSIRPRVLGRPSALAFCAYLHRYGKPTEGDWVVTHVVDLAEEFRAAGKSHLIPEKGSRIGQKFLFRLPRGRDLPRPIQKLTPTGVAAVEQR